MSEAFSSELMGQELEVIRLPNGKGYVELDRQTSIYLRCRRELSKATLAVKSYGALPIEAFFLPPGAYFAKDQNLLRHLVSVAPKPYLCHCFYTPAIQLKVIGDVTKDGSDYVNGSRLQFFTGILFMPAIAEWEHWKPVNELWTAKVWEQAALDYRKFQDSLQFPELPLDTMKVAPLLREMFTADEKTRKLCRLLQREVKDSSGIVSSYLGLQESGDIIDNFNESTDPEERELTLLKMVSERRFSAIADVSNDGIKPILQKFLAIQMLIGFWERNSCSGRKQAENIEQLTFGSPIQHKHLSNYLQMSGCKPRGAKLLKDMIASIRSEATEYFSEEAKAEAIIRDI